MDDRCLILFQNVHIVIKSEQLIRSKGFEYQIIPVPSNISSECGMCIAISTINSNDVSLLLDSKQINYQLYIE